MATATKRASDVMVKVIDLEKIIERDMDKLKEIFNKQYPDTDQVLTGASAIGDHALVKVDNKLYMLNTEGVGSDIDLDDPEDSMTIELYAEMGESRGMMPFVGLGIKDLEDIPLKDEAVNLADFIRTFGSRLEENFRVWNRELSGKTNELV